MLGLAAMLRIGHPTGEPWNSPPTSFEAWVTLYASVYAALRGGTTDQLSQAWIELLRTPPWSPKTPTDWKSGSASDGLSVEWVKEDGLFCLTLFLSVPAAPLDPQVLWSLHVREPETEGQFEYTALLVVREVDPLQALRNAEAALSEAQRYVAQ